MAGTMTNNQKHAMQCMEMAIKKEKTEFADLASKYTETENNSTPWMLMRLLDSRIQGLEYGLRLLRFSIFGEEDEEVS